MGKKIRTAIVICTLILCICGCGKADNSSVTATRREFIEALFSSDNGRYDTIAAVSDEDIGETEDGLTDVGGYVEYIKILNEELTDYASDDCITQLISNRIPAKYDKIAYDMGGTWSVNSVNVSYVDSSTWEYKAYLKLTSDDDEVIEWIEGHVSYEPEDDGEIITAVYVEATSEGLGAASEQE